MEIIWKRRKIMRNGRKIAISLLMIGSLGSMLWAGSGEDATYKNMTLEQRLYLFDGYGDKWGFDVGSDGLWLVPQRPIADTYNAPFKLRNGAATNTLVIGTNDESNTTNGYVGIGTTTPEATLDVNGTVRTRNAVTAHFVGATSDSALKMMDIGVNNSDASQKSDVGFQMGNLRENFAWVFRTWEPSKGFAIAKYGNGAKKEFMLYDTDPTNPRTVVLKLGNGASCDGTWNDASSRELKQNIRPLSDEEALKAFEQLRPVTYAYKANPDEFRVGFIAEDVPDLVANNNRKSLSAMDMVALLAKVVQIKDVKIEKIEAELRQKDERLRKMEEKIAEMDRVKKRLSSLEQLLSNLAFEGKKGRTKLSGK